MAALDAFLLERRMQPWPRLVSDWAPAKALRDAYVVYMAERPELARLNPQDFAVAVEAAGYPKSDTPDGHFYDGLTVETRANRAEAETRESLADLVYQLSLSRAKREHATRKHPDASHCAHGTPEAVLSAARADALAEVESWAGESGEVARQVSLRYSAYLRHAPGDPDPGLLRHWATLERDRNAGLRVVTEHTAEAERLRALVPPKPADVPQPVHADGRPLSGYDRIRGHLPGSGEPVVVANAAAIADAKALHAAYRAAVGHAEAAERLLANSRDVLHAVEVEEERVLGVLWPTPAATIVSDPAAINAEW